MLQSDLGAILRDVPGAAPVAALAQLSAGHKVPRTVRTTQRRNTRDDFMFTLDNIGYKNGTRLWEWVNNIRKGTKHVIRAGYKEGAD